MKNPKECFCLRQKQTFFVLNELSTPECIDGSEPLTMHHEVFSRFNFVIINADKKATSANIPVSAIPGIFQSVKDFNILSKFKNLNLSAQKEKVSENIAYTTKISAGKLKGKTPAAVLLENPEDKKLLENQISWLKQNLKNYPKNQSQIDAIKEAIRLFDHGELDSTPTAETTGPQIVYQPGMRPLIRRLRKNDPGRCFVYEVSISWNENTPRPLEFTIRNYYAPVKKTNEGLLNVMVRDRVDEQTNSFRLTLDEWFWMEHVLEAQIRTFENMYSSSLYKKAFDEEKKNKEMFKKMGA